MAKLGKIRAVFDKNIDPEVDPEFYKQVLDEYNMILSDIGDFMDDFRKEARKSGFFQKMDLGGVNTSDSIFTDLERIVDATDSSISSIENHYNMYDKMKDKETEKIDYDLDK